MQKKQLLPKFSRVTLSNFRPVLLIFFISLLIFFSFMSLHSFFTVKTIQIEGDIDKNSIRGLQNLKNRYSFLISHNYISLVITENNPTIELEEINTVFPDKIILSLKSKEAISRLKLNQGFALLDHEGIILKKSKNADNLPLINFYQKMDYFQLVPGNKIEFKEIELTLTFLITVTGMDLQVDSIDINGLNMIIFNLKRESSDSEGRKIYFSAEKDWRKQRFELETLIKRFTIEAKTFKVLDLRFDKPVIKF